MDKTSTIVPAALDQYRLSEEPSRTKRGELGQQQFFELMVAQLKNQDPMKPMESGEFLGQIAQFGTVNGISELQQSFATLAGALQSSQALQASTMVGRDVLVARDTLQLNATGGATFAAQIPETAAGVQISLADASGQIVRRFSLGPQQTGTLNVVWDGLTDSGGPARPGMYGVKIEANINGEVQAVAGLGRARVDSVSLSRDGLPPRLNLNGLGTVAMNEVIEIR